MKVKRVIFFFLCLMLSNLSGFAQIDTSATDTCQQIDVPTIISKWRNKAPKEKIEGANSLILIPVLLVNPATGLAFGAGGQYVFKLPITKLYSMVSGTMQFTTKRQLILMLKNNVYTKNERFFLIGDWRYLKFSQDTYGLGTNAPEGGILEYQLNLAGYPTRSNDYLTQPMSFDFIRFHQTAAVKLHEGVYFGVGYRYDAYQNIKDERLSLAPGDSLITSHYGFNTLHGFATDSYFNSAISLNFLIDTRDNMVNSYTGYHLNVGWRGAYEFMGNTVKSNMLDVEWRSFHGLSKTNKAHLIAFWAMVNLTESGKLPYMILPATAYDQRGRSARGYTQGRFRGENMAYTEAEYRFPITGCGGPISGVLFVNATSASNDFQDLRLMQSIRAGYGFGFRLMLDKHSRTNLAIDFGFGQQSFGFFLAASETF